MWVKRFKMNIPSLRDVLNVNEMSLKKLIFSAVCCTALAVSQATQVDQILNLIIYVFKWKHHGGRTYVRVEHTP